MLHFFNINGEFKDQRSTSLFLYLSLYFYVSLPRPPSPSLSSLCDLNDLHIIGTR